MLFSGRQPAATGRASIPSPLQVTAGQAPSRSWRAPSSSHGHQPGSPWLIPSSQCPDALPAPPSAPFPSPAAPSLESLWWGWKPGSRHRWAAEAPPSLEASPLPPCSGQEQSPEMFPRRSGASLASSHPVVCQGTRGERGPQGAGKQHSPPKKKM